MGYLRVFLAIAVVHGHLMTIAWKHDHFVVLNAFWQQRIAVFGFFLLSGFLITRVVCEIYGNSLAGKYRFILNRIIRIYPIYFTCLIIAYLCLSIALQTPAGMPGSGLLLPSSWAEWWPQLTIIGLTPLNYPTEFRGLLPTAWTLGVELIYYVILGLLTATSRAATWAAFSAAVMWIIYNYSSHVPHIYHYKTVLGPAALFFLGSLTYHYRLALRPWLTSNGLLLAGLTAAVVYLPDMLGIYNVHRHWQMLYMHLSAFVFAWIIAGIYRSGEYKTASPIEQFFADISYPVFLLHWPVTALVQYLFNIQQPGYLLFFSGLACTLAISSLIVLWVDIPLKNVRKRIRTKAKAQHDASQPA